MVKGGLEEAIKGADVFIGFSVAGALKEKWVSQMAEKGIVFAMANPVPEIMPDKAKQAGAFIIATGRSDFPNQINNILAFPGIFRGLLDEKIKKIDKKMMIRAAEAIASIIKKPAPNKIIPSVFNKKVVKKVAESVKRTK